MCTPDVARDEPERSGGQSKWKETDEHDAAETRLSARTLNAAEAASYLGVTERFVRKLVETRRIAYLKVGRLVRFQAADLDAYLKSCRVEMVERTASPRPRCRR